MLSIKICLPTISCLSFLIATSSTAQAIEKQAFATNCLQRSAREVITLVTEDLPHRKNFVMETEAGIGDLTPTFDVSQVKLENQIWFVPFKLLKGSDLVSERFALIDCKLGTVEYSIKSNS